MTRPPILTYRQAKSYSSQAPRKSRPKFHKHPIPSKDLPSRVQRLTDRFRLVAGRSFHRLSRRWQRSLQILCVHVQLLCSCAQVATVVAAAAACSFAGKWGSIFSHLLDSASLGSRRRTSKVCFFPPLFAFFCFFLFFILDGSGGRRSWCTAAAAALREASSLLQFSLYSSPAAGVALVSSHLHVASRLPLSEPLCPHLQGP